MMAVVNSSDVIIRINLFVRTRQSSNPCLHDRGKIQVQWRHLGVCFLILLTIPPNSVMLILPLLTE